MHGSSLVICNGLQPEEAKFSLLEVLNYFSVCREAYAELAFLSCQFQSHVTVNLNNCTQSTAVTKLARLCNTYHSYTDLNE